MADLINPAADLDRVACCALHRSGGCCDPEDCGPCCEACPTCPSGMRARLRDSVQLVLETPLSVSDDRAELVINTVFAYPEVLRALAGVPAPDVTALLRRLDEIEQRIERYEWSAAGTLAPQAKIRVGEVRALLAVDATEEARRG